MFELNALLIDRIEIESQGFRPHSTYQTNQKNAAEAEKSKVAVEYAQFIDK